MPNRLIKESIKRSTEIDSLSWFQEVCFYRLMVTVDDNGCYYANPQIIKSDLFPLKENLTKAAVAEALDKLESVGLIKRYEVDGKSYLHLTKWAEHQRIRNKTKHFPDPDEAPEPMYDNPPQSAASCGESPRVAANRSLNPRIQESKNQNPIMCSEPETAREHEPHEESVFQIILNDKTYFDITQSMIDEYQDLYPGVDVPQEIRKMVGWSEANVTKRKTRRGAKAFVNNWLARAQDKAPKRLAATETARTSFSELVKGESA